VVFSLVESIQYVPSSVVIQTIVKKLTGIVSLIAVESGVMISGTIIPFDTFIQIIDGNAAIFIDGQLNRLATGQSIIIPAHTSNSMEAQVRFKMLSTVIKSGYEDISVADLQ